MDSEQNNIAVIEENAITNPLDMPPELFQAGLDRRKTNRDSLMAWVKDALVENVDFGKIHVIKKDVCPKGKYCDNPHHFAKPSLFKPGAEKICGMLGMTPTFPNLPEYEAMVLNGGTISRIILRCVMISGNGQEIAEGIGARSLKQDSGDLNKALKMCLKSAQIDATLRCAGLSEVFTQDIEDMNWDQNGNSDRVEKKPVKFDRTAKIGFSKQKDKTWEEVDIGFLNWCIEKIDNGQNKDFAKLELKAREETPQKKLASEIDINKLKVAAVQSYGEKDAEGELHLAIQKKFGVTIEHLTPEQANDATTGLKKATEGKLFV